MPHRQDVRYAFRLLVRTPGFTLLTLLVLAGGLGLSTFTFSFLYTAMLRPLPLAEGERVVRVDPVVGGRRQGVDAADLPSIRGALRAVRELAAYTGREVVVGRDEDGTTSRVVDATVAEPALFGIARTPALLGRALVAADAAPGAEPTIVLAYRTWEVAFNADRAVVGRQVVVDGVSTRVVGVMPKGFGFPVASEAWLPLPATTFAPPAAATSGVPNGSGVSLRLVGRLAPGVSHAAAASEATPLLRRTLAARDSSVRREPVAAAVESFPAVQIGEERALVFTVLNGLAALILLLALVNVTNLLLARANERVRETAVRLALGASPGRLATQGMWETVLLCVAGGALGTAGAAWGLAAITRWTQANIPGNLAFWWVWKMDAVALLGAGAFVTVAIAVLGGVVALRTSGTNVREVMQEGTARAGSRRVGRLSRALVTTQVTTVTVLMFVGVLAAVMARRVLTLDPGFPTARLVQAGVQLPEARYATDSARAIAFRAIHDGLAAEGALDRVLLRRTLAARGSSAGRFERRDARQSDASSTAFVVATFGDLATVSARVTEGRGIDASDDARRAPVAVISRALAVRHWRGRSPVGDQLRLAGVGDTTRWATIVGVASDVLYGDPLARDRSAEAIYVPLLQQPGVDYTAFLVRHRGSEVAARQAILRATAAVDPLLAPDSVQPYDEVLRTLSLVTTSVARLFAGCFAFALMLALVGTFGLMSRAIGLRTREIGVRRALGASDRSVTHLLLTQGGRQLGVGTLVAAPILAAVGAAFMHFFPVSGWITTSAAVLVSASIVTLILATTWVPTRRVLRVAPRDALWRE